jgi:1,2-diacylglycerol 3-beta-galactosyltransferase
MATPALNNLLHVAIRVWHLQEVKVLEAYWNCEKPDMVVSLVPHFNRVMLAGLRRVSSTITFVTIMTNIADYPPGFWIEPQKQYLICGSSQAMKQARELGYSEKSILQTSGMIINPCFYEAVSVDRYAERKKLGLEPELPTGLVMFGGHGSKSMRDILRWLNESNSNIQLILLCGHNAILAEELRSQSCRFPVHVVEFTKDVPYYMRLSDFFIGKPGPGSISEALAMQLPVIVEKNARTLPQERYNTRWIRENAVGIVISSFRFIVGAVEQMLQPENYSRLRANAAALNNRAVFEIPVLLQKILGKSKELRTTAA